MSCRTSQSWTHFPAYLYLQGSVSLQHAARADTSPTKSLAAWRATDRHSEAGGVFPHHNRQYGRVHYCTVENLWFCCRCFLQKR